MSQKAVDDLIARMATDPGFHSQLRSDPATAMAGLDLTESERTLVLALAPDHEERVTRLAPRSSKSALFFGSALHDAAAVPAHSAGAAAAAAHSASGASGAGHAAAGASPVEQAITWASAMDPGAADEEAEAVAEAANLLQAGGQALEEAEEEVAEGSGIIEGGAPG